jgi:hypothetical protein
MTTTITTARATSSAPSALFFDRWADMDSWPEWSTDLQWARLDGPFEVGSSGALKPARGPKTAFRIDQLDPGRTYVDVSRLPGARLTFSHITTELPDGGCQIDVSVTLAGPASWLWARILGSGMRASTQADLDRLVGVVEAGL